MHESNKKMKEMLERFYDEQAAKEMAEDVEVVANYFRSSGIRPERLVVEDIKSRVSRKLAVRKSRSVGGFFFKFAAAAVFMVAIISVGLLQSDKTSVAYVPVHVNLADSFWQVDFVGEDEQVSFINSEIEQIENGLLEDEFGDEGFDSDRVDGMELEITESLNDFWKV